MILCIDGSDIAKIGLDLFAWNNLTLSDNGWRHVKGGVIETGPEGYLAAITRMVDLDDLEGIVIVQGPGSATALRTSLAIANTLALTKHIPLYGVEKGMPWDAVMTADGPQDGVEHLEPVYATDARITPSKKDHLRRAL